MKKRWLKWTLGIVAGIVCILVLVLALLKTAPAKRFLIGKLGDYLRSHAGIDLQISQFHWSLLKGSASLEDITLRAVAAPDLPPLFRVNRIDVRADIFNIVRGHYVLTDLRLEKPVIHYYIGKDGRTNLPPSGKGSGSAPDILIVHAEAIDGFFQLQDLSSEISSIFPKWRLSVEGDPSTHAHRIALNFLQDSFFEYKTRTFPITSLELSAVLEKTALQINHVQLIAADSKVSIKGSLHDFDNPNLDIQITPDLNVDRIAQILDLQKPFRGKLSGTVQAKGRLDDLEFDVQLADIQPDKLQVRSRAEWIPDSQKLIVHELDLTVPQGSLNGSALLFPGSKPGVNSIEATIRSLDLFPLWQQINPPFDLASQCAGKVSLKWEGAFSPERISASAHLNLVSTRSVPEHNLLPVSGVVDARMQSNRIFGTLRSFKVFETQLDGRFSLFDFRDIEGDFQGESRNLNTLFEQLSPFLGKSDPLVDLEMEGPFHFNAGVSGNLSHPAIVAAIEAPQLQAGPFKHLQVETNATLQDSQVGFHGTVKLPQDSVLSVDGNLDIQDHDTILSLDAITDQLPATAIPAMLDSQFPVNGNVKARLHLEGPTDNLAGTASISADDLLLYSEPLGHLDADLRLSNKIAQLTQFKLLKDPENSDSNYLEGQLIYSLETGRFQFQATGKELVPNQLALSDNNPILAKVNVLASGTGTLGSPSIDLSLNCDDFQIGLKSFGPVSVNGTLRNERIALDALAPRLNLSATALAVNHEPYAFRMELQAKDSDITQVGLALPNGQPVTGTTDAELTVSGNLEDLQHAYILARVDNLNLQAGDFDTHTRAPVEMEFRNNSIEFLSKAILVNGNSTLEVTGIVPVRQPAPEGVMEIKGTIDLAQATELAPLPEGLAAEGTLNLDVSLVGTTEKIDSKGTITLDNGTLWIPKVPIPLTGMTLRASIQKGSLVLQRADGALGSGSLTLTGEMPLGLLSPRISNLLSSPEGPARFSLDLKDFKPEETGLLPEDISGLVSLNAAGTADRIDPSSLVARIVFSALTLQAGDIEIRQKEPVSIAVRDGVASIQSLSLKGLQGNLVASGAAGVFTDSPWDLRLTGDLDAALLVLLSDDFKAAGKMQFQATIAGHLSSPTVSGFATMNGGKLTLRNPRVIADSLSVRLNFSPNQIAVQEFQGILNGGSLSLAGTIGYGNGSLKDFNLKAELQDVFMNFPDGLKSRSNGNVTVTSSGNNIVIGGSMRVVESSYRENFEVGGRLLDYLKNPKVIESDREPSPFLARMRLNVTIRTVTPMILQNNIAKVEADGNIGLVGTFYEPSLVGIISLYEGGEIILNQQTYYVDKGTITLANQRFIDPDLNIQAQTEAQAKGVTYNIILQLTGSPDKLTTTLTSEPPLPESDIVSLILTGNTASETQNLGTVQTQALSLLVGQAGEEVIAEARRALHLTNLRIDPGELASDTDPGARLTLGQDITRNLHLMYSMNLTKEGDQIWAAQYNIARRFKSQVTRITKQQEDTYRFEFRHDLRFGGPTSSRPSRGTATRFKIGSIQFQGAALFPEKTLLDTFEVQSGDKYEFQNIQKGLDRLHDFYMGEKRLQADIRLRRDTNEKTIDLQLSVDPGPLVDFAYEGFPVSEKVQEQVVTAWSNGVFDSERFDDAVLIIRRFLVQKGYLQSNVTHTVESNGSKKIRFQIDPGVQFSNVSLHFTGAEEILANQLEKTLDQAGLRSDIYTEPEKVADYLKRYYLDRGYLEAHIGSIQPHLDPAAGSGQIDIPIQEGPLFTIGDLEFDGNEALSNDELRSAMSAFTGRSCDPNTLRKAVQALETYYHRKGYNDATATSQVILNSRTSRARIAFDITERLPSIIRDITINGNHGTSLDFVQKQLVFQVGDALDFAKIDETRKRLYATGIYSSVDFQDEEIPGTAPSTQEKSIRINIRLVETQPYRLQYGLSYDTKTGLGGLLEEQNLNILGRASNLGVSLRSNYDFEKSFLSYEGRLYYSEPFIKKIHVKMDASAFYKHEKLTGDSFPTDTLGFSVTRRNELPRAFRLDYGYRFDHVRWEQWLPQVFDPIQNNDPVGRLIGTITRDTRDSILDPTRGEFTSHSLEYGPRMLGSGEGFARYYGQYFRYVPLEKFLGRPIKDPEGRPLPTNLVYAGALRLGLTSPFGNDEIIRPERFFAGGGTTMRGFQQDLMGPLETKPATSDPEDTRTVSRATGGEALFLFNNELRFPIVGILQGVGFLDIGNVYRKISDVSFDLRKSAGVGLRLKIKYIPLRFDYGFKLDRKPGESRGAFFFSIGQAF